MIASVLFGDGIRIVTQDGSVHEHTDSADAWRIQLPDEKAVALRGARSIDSAAQVADDMSKLRASPPTVLPIRRAPLAVADSIEKSFFELGRDQYRRSELAWEDAGRPTALVQVRSTSVGLVIDLHVPVSDRTFAPADAVNRYDNEAPDINGDGVQLYLRTGETLSGWMLIPKNNSSSVRVRQLDGWRAPRQIDARWSPTETGYNLHITIPGHVPDALDIIVNEKPVGRERRRGQLVLSGARGEFVYLRGDRHDRERLIPVRIDE
jgi:hypothetical protein